MTSELEVGKDKAPAGVLAAVRTGGRKISFEWLSGSHALTDNIGDIIERVTATQSIGIITDVGAQYQDNAADKAANPTPVLAQHREDITLQIEGKLFAPTNAVSFSDGDLVAWVVASNEFQANATGAHIVCGEYSDSPTHILVDINVNPGAAT